MKSFSPNLNRHCLIPGLVILAIGILGSYIYLLFVGETQALIESSSLVNLLINEMPLFILIMTLLFAPIVEEFSFRSWTMKSKFWKYFSLIAITASTYFTIYSIILTCVAFVVLLFLFFIFDSEKHKDLIQLLRILVTSILFSLVHYGNESGWFAVMSFIYRLGLALIICYIAMRFRFIYAIVLHFANNLLVFVLSYFFVTDYTFEIKADDHTAKLTEISLFESPYSYIEDGYCVNEIVNTGCLPNVAYSLVEDPYRNDLMYYPIATNYNHYKYCATAVDSVSRLNYQQLFEELVQQTGLKLDTITPEKIYHLEITDTSRLVVSGRYENTMGNFVKNLRNAYRIFFVLDDSCENIKISSKTKSYWQMDLENLIPHLYEQYGIKVEERDNKDCKIIYIWEP